MSRYFVWLILARATGSPIASGVAVLLFYWAIDRYTLGLLPDPFRLFNAIRRQWKLETHLKHAVHDRKARLDLAEVYIQRKKYAKAVEMIRPNLEAGDDDVVTVFDMGVACLGAGHTAQGEKLLAHVLEMDPDFRVGEIHLVLGRWRLERGDFAGAKQALEQLVSIRKGTIEGRLLLSRALEGVKDDGAAALMRDQAWHEYVVAPRFQRRRERWWAWRARPSRPALYAVLILIGMVLFGRFVAPALASQAATMDDDDYGYGYPYGAPAAGQGTEVASCTALNSGSCREYERLMPAGVATVKDYCAKTNGQFANGPCSRENVFGRCETAALNGSELWYRGQLPTGFDPEPQCTASRGTWHAGP